MQNIDNIKRYTQYKVSNFVNNLYLKKKDTYLKYKKLYVILYIDTTLLKKLS